jgi:hypothetical protein
MFSRGVVVGFDPKGGLGPVETAKGLLLEKGLREPSQGRWLKGIPQGRWMIQKIEGEDVGRIRNEINKRDPLWCAVVLGLCGETIFSPQRPVIWSEKRLGRIVRLWQVGNFYED